MSDTVEIGIDLGTTNSVISTMDNGRPVIIPGPDGNAVTPSFVGINNRGEIEVGSAAKRLQLEDPNNVAEGFKRALSDLEKGDLAKWTFPKNGITYSALDLSAILLTELVRSAAVFLNESPTSAVITVPAAFGEVEKRAIIHAAEQSGLSYIQLVQEPVAAGLAYGWDRADDTTPFLIFDLGGGTFDLSVMRCESGQLIVMGHRGERIRGGRDIDDRILEEIVAPILRNRVSQDEWETNKPRLLQLCETAKEHLSRADTYPIAIEGKLIAIDGTPISDVINVRRREDLEPLLQPMLSRTMSITNELLEELSMVADDLAAIVLVGGPTRTPALRDFLENQFGVKVHTRIDPMTVVAQGAALYAASLRKPVIQQQPSPGEVSIRLSYEPLSASDTAPIGIGAESGVLPDGTNFRIARADGGWASGLIPMNNGRIITQVVLAGGEQCNYTLQAFTPDGSEVRLIPNEFTITHGLAAAPPPLSRSIGVVVAALGSESLEFSVLAKRGEPTPVNNKRTYRTTTSINPGNDADAFEIHFREGESSKPLRNRPIGIVTIKGSEVEFPMPAGSDVEITLRISPSEEASAKVYIPMLNKTWDNKLEMEVELPPDDVIEDLRRRFYAEEIRLGQLQSSGSDIAPHQTLIQDLRREFDRFGLMDRGGVQRTGALVEELEERIDNQETALGPVRALAALAEVESISIGLIDELGEPAEKLELVQLKDQADKAREMVDARLALSTSEAMVTLASTVYWRQDGAWVSRFQEMAENQDFTDPAKANYLIQQGRVALDSGDISVLRQVVLGLQNLETESNADDPLSVFRGLRELS